MASNITPEELEHIHNLKVVTIAHERYPTWYNIVEMHRAVQGLANIYVERIQNDEQERL